MVSPSERESATPGPGSCAQAVEDHLAGRKVAAAGIGDGDHLGGEKIGCLWILYGAEVNDGGEKVGEFQLPVGFKPRLNFPRPAAECHREGGDDDTGGEEDEQRDK